MKVGKSNGSFGWFSYSVEGSADREARCCGVNNK